MSFGRPPRPYDPDLFDRSARRRGRGGREPAQKNTSRQEDFAMDTGDSTPSLRTDDFSPLMDGIESLLPISMLSLASAPYQALGDDLSSSSRLCNEIDMATKDAMSHPHAEQLHRLPLYLPVSPWPQLFQQAITTLPTGAIDTTYEDTLFSVSCSLQSKSPSFIDRAARRKTRRHALASPYGASGGQFSCSSGRAPPPQAIYLQGRPDCNPSMDANSPRTSTMQTRSQLTPSYLWT